MTDPADDDAPGMTDEQIAALPLDPAELFDPAGRVDADGVLGDRLLQKSATPDPDETSKK